MILKKVWMHVNNIIYFSIMVSFLSIVLLISACQSQPHNETESAAEVPDFDGLYETLGETDRLFSDYDGSDRCVVRNEGMSDSMVTFPNLFDVFYWKSTDPSASVEYAAEQLTSVMLDSINDIPEERRWFTLTDYHIYPAVCYSSENAGEALEGLKLPENTWLVAPEYTFDYTGKTIFSERKDCEAKNLIAEDGLVSNVSQGPAENEFYIMMRQGDVWRMERLTNLLPYVLQ